MDGSETRQVLDAFKPIGAKMRPDMSVDQGAHWATAIVLALSDLPAWIAVQALREAVHIPFDFPTEMETQVREIANRIHDKHLRALRRLRSLQDAILRATNAQPLIEDAIKPEEPMTLEEVRKMYRGALGKELVRMGLTAGAIREEDLAIVCAEVEAEASCQERANCGGSLHPTASNASHNGKERGKSFGSPPQPRTPKSSKGLSVSNKRQGWSTHSEGTRSISPASRIVSAQAPQPRRASALPQTKNPSGYHCSAIPMLRPVGL